MGAYGIGMKRAIFKMGKECSISTRNERDAYDVEIEPDWIERKKVTGLSQLSPRRVPLNIKGPRSLWAPFTM